MVSTLGFQSKLHERRRLGRDVEGCGSMAIRIAKQGPAHHIFRYQVETSRQTPYLHLSALLPSFPVGLAYTLAATPACAAEAQARQQLSYRHTRPTGSSTCMR